MTLTVTNRVSAEGLAEALVRLERTMTDARPATVVLADDSDEALAAALVAAKLLIPLEATPQALSGASTNARLIAQLASTSTGPR